MKAQASAPISTARIKDTVSVVERGIGLSVSVRRSRSAVADKRSWRPGCWLAASGGFRRELAEV